MFVRDDFFAPFESAMDSLFNDVMRNFPESVKATSTNRLYPKCDVYKLGDDLVFEAAIPFLNKEDLKLVVEDDVFSISGECEKDLSSEEKNYFRKELRRTRFSRAWVLPKEVLEKDPEIDAEFKDGMLFVRFKDAYKALDGPETKVKIIELK